ncbi:hypothetical protein OG266_10560 [Streptomyces sp. NBC_00554]|uniref:hypothetical protein n=1 Tax=Streptomyces sp. NBC_00554 TaxID=2903661 RepID=UPI00352EBB8C|nr:hypothetical protein OG266_10560 [Streptomyces sp. NBC_00554]
MARVVHLRLEAAEGSSTAAYSVKATIFEENGVTEPPVIPVPPEPDGQGRALWGALAGFFPPAPAAAPTPAPDSGIGAMALAVLRIHAPELHDIDWEGLARETSEAGVTQPVTVLRSEVGAGNFQPGESMSFRDLPLRVLVIGVDPSVEQGAEPTWHEDVAVHAALSAHAERWEVDVLPGPASHDSLAESLKEIQPHVLHLAGEAARDLRVDGPYALGGLNLSSVRLVVSSSAATPPEAHRLLRPYVRADAPHPVPAAISLTPWPEYTSDLCSPVKALYKALAEGRGIDDAVACAVTGEHGPLAAASVTVNCLPGRVLPGPPAQVAAPAAQDREDVHELYQPLIGATDRVAQRRKALDLLESGAHFKQLIVLSGSGAGDQIGTTCLMLSLLRVWEKRPQCRALYLNFKKLRSNMPLRPAGAPPGPRPDVVVETVALLAESVKRDSGRNGGWGIDEDLDALVRDIDRLREGHRKGGHEVSMGVTREDILKKATDLVVKLAPPGTHLVLALDHFAETDAERSEAPGLVTHLFDTVLHSRSVVSIVTTARDPGSQAAEWLECFTPSPHHITLQPWPSLRAGPLLRELGVQLMYDWHDNHEWQEMVREKLRMITGDFGPKFLNEVYGAAVTQIG